MGHATKYMVSEHQYLHTCIMHGTGTRILHYNCIKYDSLSYSYSSSDDMSFPWYWN